MRRALRTFLTPGWVAFTLLIWAGAVTMVFLGRWQLQVSNRRHFDLQNFSYTLQWWAFALCAVGFWGKVGWDTWHRRPTDTVAAAGEVVLRGGSGGIVPIGPAELAAPARPGQAPVVYRGYVMPKSSTTPARSEGDPFHSAYNDYLWQLSLADSPEDLPGPGAGAPDDARGE